MRYSTAAAAAAALLGSRAAAQNSDFPTIEIKGSKMFYSNNGTQFFIQGVAYQQDVNSNTTVSDGNSDYTDPLANIDACSRDIPYLRRANTNTIRVYALDPTQNHDECMNMLMDNGIYVVADLSAPVEGQSINRMNPSWDDDTYRRYTDVVDMMQQYPNTLGFFAGNEVTNQANNTDASAFVKAAVRDMKAYIRQQNYRAIPVGYATNDDDDIRLQLADYFNCGDQSEAIDFWGYNIYSWCGDSSFTRSGYDQRTKEFAGYSVPIFFAEYGCNEVQPREFTEVGTIFGDEMTGEWSGAIMYMYFQEENNYGLVSVSGDSVSTLDDYRYYSSQMNAIRPSGVNSASYTPTATQARECPTVDATWAAVGSPLPQTPSKELCNCMMASLGCVVADDVDAENYGDVFGEVCGYNDGDACAGIQRNASTGRYGAYSMCNPREQLSFVLDQYYQSQGSAASACDFGGQAVTRDASESNSTCSDLLDQAGSDGTGTVESGSGSESDRPESAATVALPGLSWGALQLGAYVSLAVTVGASMMVVL